MANKTWVTWEQTRLWCLTHPEQAAAIMTSRGTFTVVFTPRDDLTQLLGTDYQPATARLKGPDNGT